MTDLLQNINDESEDDPSSQIQSRLLTSKKNKNKIISKQSSSNDLLNQNLLSSNRKIDTINVTVTNQGLVSSELKKVI